MNSRKNLINLAVFLFIALLSMLLIMAAINMMDLPGIRSRGGENNNKTSQNDGNGNNRDKQRNEGNGSGKSDSQYDWRDRAKRRREERKGFNDRNYSYGQKPESMIPGYGEDYGGVMPEQMPNIDISGNEGLPEMPFGMGGNTLVLREGKNPHTPAFEVLGVPNYPFVKVMTMENYLNNRWIMSSEEPELRFLLGEKMNREFSKNSVKIKPVEPSKGYIPVLSGNYEMKYDFSLMEYKKSGVFYSNELIENFYEMVYETPPTEAQLRYAKTDGNYEYDVYIPKVVELIVDEVIENCYSDYEAIKFVEEFLLENYTYDNSVINNYGDKDGISAFLLGEDRVGNHLDFLSAYAIILRAVGIPCRLALGYKLLPNAQYQVVYADQVYIYPEIKFEDYGWVPMDVFSYDVFYNPPEKTITQITFADDTARRGNSITVRGTVTDSLGNPLDNMTVLIYLKKYKEEPCLSYSKVNVSQGSFEAVFNITGDTNAGKYHVIADLLENDIYRTSSSDPELKVITDTFLEIDSPENIFGNKFNFSGKILDEFSFEGVKGLEVNVSFEHLNLVETIESGEDGILSGEIEIDIPEDYLYYKNFFFAGRYYLPYDVEFTGTDIYSPYSTMRGLYVWEIYWANVLIVVLSLAGILLCVLIVLKKKGMFHRDNIDLPVLAAEGPGVGVTTDMIPELVKKEEYRFYIEFPQIAEGLPDVWGVGDGLSVVFYDSEGNKGEFKEIFHKKGEYRIKISGDNGEHGTRNIRIVDYREEIIGIGKNFLREISERVLPISDVMTLREVLDVIKPKIVSERHWVLESAFSVLEKAVYSDEDVGRNDYERFYIFVKELRQNSSI
ncbi:transglutaminase domain-containing protein [Acetivibrio straminisolvens]|uniref:transglutaminase domain-containing protein n=1 Tax=Acetivibrio straminisolvens TaxID=253314 RepID=UPI00223F8854|nr:transglutaminase domain-containing protein [Acetivibrio straminisolvens]